MAMRTGSSGPDLSWERSVLALLDDLEQQAEGLHLRERDALIEDLSHGEYGTVTHASRWHASVDAEVRVDLLGGLVVRGRVARTGADWVLVLAEDGRGWLIRHAAVRAVSGLSPRSLAEEATGVVRRLSLRPVLRRLLEEDPDVRLHAVDGTVADGRLLRVGADFVEMAAARGTVVVPTFTLAAVVRGQ